MKCPLCITKPNSHSFKHFGTTTEGTALYYTAPAQATARDDAYTLRSLQTHMAEIQGPWIWVLDCTGMEIQHQYTMQYAVALADMLVAEHSNLLRRIIVIHPNAWIYRIMHVMRQDIQDCVYFANRPMEILNATLNFTSEAKTWLRLAIKS